MALRDHDDVPAWMELLLPAKFHWQEAVDVQHWFFIPILLCAIFYVPGFKFGVYLMKDRRPFNLKGYMLVHNAVMALFSAIGTVYAVWVFAQSVMESGSVTGSVCSGFFYRTRAGFWCFLFSASKVFELSETVVQVLEKKNIIFLHWFHHYVTFVYCWVGSYYTDRVPSGIWFCVMNYFVHAVMYFYFFMATLKGKGLWWGKYVTHIQIIQMIIGVWVTGVSYQCSNAEPFLVYAATAMYSVYLWLFVKLYFDKYFGDQKKADKLKEKAAAGSEDKKKSS